MLGVVVVGGIGWALSSDSDSSDDDGRNEDGSFATQMTDPFADAGQCTTEDLERRAEDIDVVSCEDPTAYWEVTAVSTDVDDTMSFMGSFYDNYDKIEEVCGQYFHHGPWNDWFVVYDETDRSIYYLMCLAPLDKPDADGFTLRLPAAGECVDANMIFVVDCSDSAAEYETLKIEHLSDTPHMGADIMETEIQALLDSTCEGTDWTMGYWHELPNTDIVNGGVTHVLCLTEA
ncbi:hypothetical protein [Natronoglycomyces albus]|uniref:Uncharacterized protein n=1 Tax=Natronoglycomyces albus TaxID=2811108 RepID=A0A895XKP7_9ACTN|nr:hypothetical protein [Natronoglycomyces albus]QSB03999.1 hypothetical protein JQS30_09195 [Natronoglycomyces albus]